jgi:hypothetical protein
MDEKLGYGTFARITSVTVSGLTLGRSYVLSNTVASLSGATGERSMTLRCARY